MSDPHRDVAVEDHIKTMMANTGRSKDNERRMGKVEDRQGDFRERLSVIERITKAIEELPIKVAELAAAARNVEDLPRQFTELRISVEGGNTARNRLIVIFGIVFAAINVGLAIWAVSQ